MQPLGIGASLFLLSDGPHVAPHTVCELGAPPARQHSARAIRTRLTWFAESPARDSSRSFMARLRGAGLGTVLIWGRASEFQIARVLISLESSAIIKETTHARKLTRADIRTPPPTSGVKGGPRLAKRWGAMASAFEQTGGTRPATRRFAGPLAN